MPIESYLDTISPHAHISLTDILICDLVLGPSNSPPYTVGIVSNWVRLWSVVHYILGYVSVLSRCIEFVVALRENLTSDERMDIMYQTNSVRFLLTKNPCLLVNCHRCINLDRSPESGASVEFHLGRCE